MWELQNSMLYGLIAGMAKSGLKPILTVYSSFLQRGYDQLIHDIAIQKLPVIICVDRAGVVGQDGETHQGIFDLSYLSTIPNINILAPKDFAELEKMLKFAVGLNEPAVIRYPRGGEADIKFNQNNEISLGKAEIIEEGKDVTIVAIGKMVARAAEVSALLKGKNINSEIINVRFLNPLDKDTIINSARKTGNIITIEDNLIDVGLGTAVLKCINESDLQNIKIMNFGYKSTFVEHGKVDELEERYGLNAESIVSEMKKC
jgi:1-deoxy-D-xylulose-5-phosphate synthase